MGVFLSFTDVFIHLELVTDGVFVFDKANTASCFSPFSKNNQAIP